MKSERRHKPPLLKNALPRRKLQRFNKKPMLGYQMLNREESHLRYYLLWQIKSQRKEKVVETKERTSMKNEKGQKDMDRKRGWEVEGLKQKEMKSEKRQ
ncbi:hypothetical protein AMTR_s00096p00098990 [Amborella trichopoda]|uniref:Uncharacterized protein n=1 Tax=Amborella trichopoda TaxID=13333 RepID=W1NXP8_AMBTC|nr:hypothetical protein AMTR_s00096p00098990 [Amborella trichopoda]